MKRLSLLMILGLALPSFGRGTIDIVVGDRDRDIVLDEPVWGGSACNFSDAADIEFRNGKLKVDFEDFGARLRHSRIERVTCLFSANVQWPRGQQIVIRNVHLRGTYSAHSGTRGVATTELFTTGGFGEMVQAQVSSGSGSFHEFEAGEVYRSDCSGSGMLRMNSSVRLVGGGFGGSGAMETKELSAELTLESCH